MPEYAFRCDACGEEADHTFPIGEAPRIAPCTCGAVANLLIGRGVNISASALETKGGAVRAVDKREAGWDKDMPAYKRMRSRGMQPQQIDGAAALEDRANDNLDIELQRPGLEGVTRERMVEAKQQAAEIQEAVANAKAEASADA